MPPRDRTPAAGAALPDPDQLAFGGLETGIPPATPPGRADDVPDGGDAAVAVREPPVCGEWSFDPDEAADARVPAAATPVAGHVVVPPPPASARPAARALTPPTPLPALDELKSIHDAHPGDEQTALALSSALAKRGNIERALGVLERAIESGADGVTLRCARATILSGRLRYDDAERELRRAQKLKPDDQAVLLQQGILACRRAKWREAVDPLARVVRIDPLSAQAHFYLGEAQSKLDRLAEALDSYHRAAELDADNWRAFKGVGIVLDRMGRSAEAAEYYRRARDGQRA